MTEPEQAVTPPMLDPDELVVLDRRECLDLLRSATIGRVGVTVGALPTVLPVSYAMVGDTIVFRTGVGTKLDAATEGAVVAFEVDDIDPEDLSGWSVVVTGVAVEAVADVWSVPFRSAAVPGWAPDGAMRVLCLAADMVSGRRLPPPPTDGG